MYLRFDRSHTGNGGESVFRASIVIVFGNERNALIACEGQICQGNGSVCSCRHINFIGSEFFLYRVNFSIVKDVKIVKLANTVTGKTDGKRFGIADYFHTLNRTACICPYVIFSALRIQNDTNFYVFALCVRQNNLSVHRAKRIAIQNRSANRTGFSENSSRKNAFLAIHFCGHHNAGGGVFDRVGKIGIRRHGNVTVLGIFLSHLDRTAVAAETVQRVFLIEYLNEIALIFSFFICGKRFAHNGNLRQSAFFFIRGCKSENDEMVAIALDTGDMYKLTLFVSLFENDVSSAVRALDLIARCKEIRRPIGKGHGFVQSNGNDGISFAEEIHLLLIVKAVRTRVKGHDVIRADVTRGNRRGSHLFIGMELCTDGKICINGIPAAGIPGRNESADDGRFRIVCAAAYTVMGIHIHNLSPFLSTSDQISIMIGKIIGLRLV